MTPHIADALVVVFTYGISLKTWTQTGGITRELALYAELAEHYPRIVLFTYGGQEEVDILKATLPVHLHDKFTVVSNANSLSITDYAAQAPTLVQRALGEARSVVVKTNQLASGQVAARIASAFHARGQTCALIARGGYLWSRMSAYEHGPHSAQARAASEIESLLCSSADLVVGTTAGMIQDLCWRYGIDPARTRLVPNYILVDSQKIRPVSERTPGLLLYAGQLVYRKRVDVLIDAVAMLEEDVRKKVTLEIVGDGPELANLQAQAQRLNAPVVFRGRIPHMDLAQRMGECSLYLQASEMEGHPKTVLEAMGAGAVVVVANTPGQSEAVTHGVTGLRIPLEIEAFSRAIAELMADLDWCEVLGAGASRSALASLSLAAVLPREIEAHRTAATLAASKGTLRASA